MVDVNDFKVEVSCEYKGETYSARDNGAIMRHPREGRRARPLDNKWTFGKKNVGNGYMFFGSSVRVHQVVATALWGHQKREGMVVDHKDTNRCNNRAENLHWVTRLENALGNPITRRRIADICGSVAAFLANPSLLRESTADPNFKWMRTVSEEEAARCRSNLERWASEDAGISGAPRGKGLGEWIYGDLRPMGSRRDWPPSPTQSPDARGRQWGVASPPLVESLTPNAMQDWRTPTEFPLCPAGAPSLDAYHSSLEAGKAFSSNVYGTGSIIGFAMSGDGRRLCVATRNPDALKKWHVTYVHVLGGKYAHENGGSFFQENGALKAIALFRGEEWTGGDGIDDFC